MRVLMRFWLCAMLAGVAGVAAAADIRVAGSWMRTATVGDLSAGIGSDLLPDLENSTQITTLTIDNAGSDPWRIEVERTSDSGWPQNVDVAVRRGNVQGQCAGDLGYITLAVGSKHTLCDGSGDASVEVEVKVHGATVHTRNGIYNLLITYRVVPR
jgi:hypothetical protein